MVLTSKPAGMRWLVVLAVTVLAMAVLVIAGNQLFALKARLAAEAWWVRWSWVVLAVAAVGCIAGLSTRLLIPRQSRSEAGRALDEHELRAAVADYSRRHVDVTAAQSELETLDERRASDAVFVAVYGEISAGKSSLIRAILPEAEISVDVRGGTTREVQHYSWRAPGGRELVLVDVPGFGATAQAGEQLATDEAGRAHLVLFIADGDLSRPQCQALQRLAHLGKPLIVALNKSDRFADADLRAIRTRIAAQVSGGVEVVTVRSGGKEEVLYRDADGSETCYERSRATDVRALRRALQQALDSCGQAIEQRRDAAVFLLTAGKLEGAVQAHRRDAAGALVQRYARRAVVGAMAAVAPGSDLIIQGALAAALVRELCGLYRVTVRELEVDRFIAALRQRTGRATPLLLGVAGNALKAFPGLGTLAGGVTHAVAYGLLFRSAGTALAESLEQRGELDSVDAIRRFEEQLRDDLEPSARVLAKTALAETGPANEHERAGTEWY